MKKAAGPFLLALGQALLAYGAANCPPYGPAFPKPTDLQHDADVQDAINSLDELVEQYIDNSNSSGSDTYSYSFEVFSVQDGTSLLSRYWTAPNLESLNTTGVKKVDGDTVYRLGSVTKIFTILTYLAQVGDTNWNDPITKYVPELAGLVANGSHNSIFTPDWDSITIGALASQTSGLIRDYSLLGELTQQLDSGVPVKLGFPPLPNSEVPPCGTHPVCNRQQTFEGLSRAPPSFATDTTPAYSDISFQLLAYALENMTGKSFHSMVNESIIIPLNLTRTFYTTPDDKLGIIPGNRYKVTWAGDMGDANPTGNMYSSSRDLARFGRAILASELIPPPLTRRWLKPSSLTSDPKATVGSPWGIRTIDSGLTYSPVTVYDKLGGIGRYTTLFTLIPDYDIGFTVMTSGDVGSGVAFSIADTLAYVLLPAMQDAARNQAEATYGGSYKAAIGSVNSSIAFATDPTRPGIGVTSWYSNGTDMMRVAIGIQGNYSSDDWDKLRPSVRLYPTGLEHLNADGSKQQAFKAIFENLDPSNNTSNGGTAFSSDCSTWVGITAIVYGTKPLDQFVFNFDPSGNVTSVEPLALRVRLNRVQSVKE